MQLQNSKSSRKAASELLFLVLLVIVLTGGLALTLVGSPYIAQPIPFVMSMFAAFALIYRKQRVKTAWFAAVNSLKA